MRLKKKMLGKDIQYFALEMDDGAVLWVCVCAIFLSLDHQVHSWLQLIIQKC